MKKLLIVLLATFCLLVGNVQAAEDLPEVTDHEKVHIYLFYWDECNHCHDFLTYFSKNYKEEYEPYFDIIAFEVKTKDNGDFTDEVRDKLKVEETGVPLIVYGDKFQVGFGEDGSEFIDAALELYQDDDYEDVVAQVLDKTEKEVAQESLSEAITRMGIDTSAMPSESNDDEDHGSDTVAIVVILAVLIAGVGGLFFLARKK